jgi:beta-mannosidase
MTAAPAPEERVDWLEGSAWECAASRPGQISGPAELDGAALRWWSSTVPGTAASAYRRAGAGDPAQRSFDEEDWWFRCRFNGPTTEECRLGRLELEGVATIWDSWLNGGHLGGGESMFQRSQLAATIRTGENELVIRCAALAPRLAQRRPRPRWKSYLVTHQNLRWFRTSLLGRIPGWALTPVPVGPWRPVRLVDPADDPVDVHLLTACDGDDGVVEVTFRLAGRPSGAHLVAGGTRVALEPRHDDRGVVLSGTLRIPDVERWWPHTHGPQPTYEVAAELDGRRATLGRVGFRTLEVDRADGAFRVVVNGVPVFCRGAVWLPPDPVGLSTSDEELDHLLGLARQAGMNMLRVPGTTVYEDERFYQRCDELGLLVWQDCMFAFLDPPQDEGFVDGVRRELADVFRPLGHHPSLAVLCGNQEVEEIAAMNGLPRQRWASALFDETIPDVFRTLLPSTPYVSSNPTGGDLPFQMDTGVCQYFGVGGYLRPLDDARRAGVRFAAECLAYATPPEPETVDDACGGAWRANHDPQWKQGVHHDAGRSWDMEDVRSYYQRVLFQTDPMLERYIDAERALDLGRATNAELMRSVFTEWRLPTHPCAGGLVLAFQDLRPGAGWGLVDALGRPKAPWYALRRVWQPLTLLVSDEGLNGLRVHVVNDTADPWQGSIRIELFARGEVPIDRGETEISVEARGASTLEASAFFDGFRDISYAYRFAPPAHDVVVTTLLSTAGDELARSVHLPLGQARALEPDVGLAATATPGLDGGWDLAISTRRFAQWVRVEIPGFQPTDSWFHLPPASTQSVRLTPDVSSSVPRGHVRALNSQTAARVVLAG